jgi:phosphatidylglycerol:prolipoprotein diacylglycerol transferase
MISTTLGYINSFNIFGIRITLYAICLLGGGFVALFLSAYRSHRKGYPWDIWDTVFIWAFPAGVVGSRIWYVIAQWQTEFANEPWYKVFMTWEGGMAIQGGVILGAIVGIAVILIKRKGWDPFEAADIAVPTILVAQAIGRWGNFFNQEVYGASVSLSGWSFVPSFITNNMLIAGSFRVPLFLLEGLINIGGYYLLARGIQIAFGRHYKSGDTLFAYFAWYGAIRFLLEPLRNATYIMGHDGDFASSNMAIFFIVFGILGIVVNHIVRSRIAKKNSTSIKAR